MDLVRLAIWSVLGAILSGLTAPAALLAWWKMPECERR